jgi:plasmid maintenance system killer protein
VGSRWIGILLLFFHLSAAASSCLLSEALKDPALSNNAKFWEEYGQLSPKDQNSDLALKALIEKFKSTQGTVPASAPTSVASNTVADNKALSLSVDHKAEKEIKHLQPGLKKKVDEFLDVALKPGGIQEIRSNPGRWHYEKLPEFGPNAHSVRLNAGYRVLFDLDGDNIVVRQVNAAKIHHN